jgi:lipid II:glycine glycyltransferase (peptidoglycan interpeptide bridge formation enzyme)
MKNSLNVRECTAEAYATALQSLRAPDRTLPLLQSPLYAGWQAADGKTVVYYAAEQDGKTVAAGLGVKYDAPGGISFLYGPYGPVVREWTPELLDAFRQFFAGIAKRTGVTFVRFDSPGLTALPGVHPVGNKLAVTASLQPRTEWLLDIAAPEDAIWMGMHKHARYNVRLAERAKASITFHALADAPLNTFMQLMETTSSRDSFSLQRRHYYESILQSTPAEAGFMAVVTIDTKPAAAAIFAAWDGQAHYVFSGSSNDFRKIAPPYFMIWQTILEARKRKWHTLNFGGITDAVKGTHLEGVTGFKKRFGGYQTNHDNPVDLVYDPLKYTLFKLYKTLRG